MKAKYDIIYYKINKKENSLYMEMLFKLLAEHVYLILFVSLILEFAALPLPGETMMVVA